MGKNENVKVKIKNGILLLKKHWKTPPDGYYVNYKEFLNLALGSGSLSFLSVIISWTTIAINIPTLHCNSLNGRLIGQINRMP